MTFVLHCWPSPQGHDHIHGHDSDQEPHGQDASLHTHFCNEFLYLLAMMMHTCLCFVCMTCNTKLRQLTERASASVVNQGGSYSLVINRLFLRDGC